MLIDSVTRKVGVGSEQLFLYFAFACIKIFGNVQSKERNRFKSMFSMNMEFLVESLDGALSAEIKLIFTARTPDTQFVHMNANRST